MSVDIVRSCTDHDDSQHCRCCNLMSLPRALITAQLKWVCSWCEISGRQTDRRISSILYHSFNWPYQEQRSPSRMFVEDRNLLPGKSLSRRIQAVNRGDLRWTQMSHDQWHSCAPVKTILHIADDAEFCDDQCLSTLRILCWWWCLSTLQMVLCWCLFRECSWLLSSNLRVMMSSEDQTIHEEMMSLFINVKFGADRARDMNYYFKFMFYNSFNWTYQGQRSPSESSFKTAICCRGKACQEELEL